MPTSLAWLGLLKSAECGKDFLCVKNFLNFIRHLRTQANEKPHAILRHGQESRGCPVRLRLPDSVQHFHMTRGEQDYPRGFPNAILRKGSVLPQHRVQT